MHLLLLALGGLLTIGGAGALAVAYRHGQDGRRDAEKVTFRAAVAALAAGSLLFLLSTVQQL
ncbi:hypothetical protein [Actinotalea sp. K2]|uniref:hypothetical protein n=1 Tax=Actinotalea sp. K2 TaxID=2939438 RepID=UPI002017A836|nr:hypothetical protein [Actinotalea sp. K2]MCL3860664.1 hypothetical protein [Actinotalea sp. K2]